MNINKLGKRLAACGSRVLLNTAVRRAPHAAYRTPRTSYFHLQNFPPLQNFLEKFAFFPTSSTFVTH
jgi:hypothetical protein